MIRFHSVVEILAFSNKFFSSISDLNSVAKKEVNE